MCIRDREKAVKELEKHLQEDGEIKATLKVQKKSVEVSLADLGLNYGDVEKVAQKAVDYGKDVYKRQEMRRRSDW